MRLPLLPASGRKDLNSLKLVGEFIICMPFRRWAKLSGLSCPRSVGGRVDVSRKPLCRRHLWWVALYHVVPAQATAIDLSKRRRLCAQVLERLKETVLVKNTSALAGDHHPSDVSRWYLGDQTKAIVERAAGGLVGGREESAERAGEHLRVEVVTIGGQQAPIVLIRSECIGFGGHRITRELT